MEITRTTAAPSDPGIYSGLSNAAYHAGPGISKSGLDLLARSPLHYWDRYINPHGGRGQETEAMSFGTAVHAAILEPDEFAKWVVMDKVDRRFKEGKAAAAEAEAIAAERGVPLIDRPTHNMVTTIAAAVRRSTIGRHLETGVPELSVYWIDEDTGVFCRCRPDWLGVEAVVDVKTTENASPVGFMRSAYSWRYWVQAAFYLDGLAANGLAVPAFLFAAVEKQPPYAVMGYRASQSMIEAGRREYKRLLAIYAACATVNRWPGYGDMMELDLPGFAPERLPDVNASALDFG